MFHNVSCFFLLTDKQCRSHWRDTNPLVILNWSGLTMIIRSQWWSPGRPRMTDAALKEKMEERQMCEEAPGVGQDHLDHDHHHNHQKKSPRSTGVHPPSHLRLHLPCHRHPSPLPLPHHQGRFWFLNRYLIILFVVSFSLIIIKATSLIKTTTFLLGS